MHRTNRDQFTSGPILADGCAIRVHGVVGPGVFENVYSECLEYELRHEGLAHETNRAVPIIYKGVRLRSKYDTVLTQLKLTGLPVGLLLNFNVVTLKEGGIKRVVNPKYAKALPADEIGG